MIKKLLREQLLLEGTHSYGCVMLSFDMPENIWSEVQDRVGKSDLYVENGEYGRETEPHCTLLYGLLPDIDDEEVEDIISGFKPVEVTLSKISVFENEDYDVLKFEISNDRLTEYNKKLSGLPNENKYPEYKAHITIAYIKKGKITDEMKSPLKKKIKLMGNKVIYSKTDDTKKRYTLK